MYSNIVKDHFVNPRNVGELEDPDAAGSAKNDVDGDQVQLHLRIQDGKITDVKMKVMGCVAAIASTSLLTEMVNGKMVEEARAITKEELTDRLGGLPERKVHCSLTCIDALHQALEQE
jgi:nitrogen fixation NifU-like protein